MPLAPFFDKAALAASHVLRGLDRAQFEHILEDSPIALAFDASVNTCSEARVALDLCANLLARLYPTIVLAPIGDNVDAVLSDIQKTIKGINTDVRLEVNASLSERPVSATIVVGEMVFATAAPAFYVGSNGWIALFSTSCPMPSGRSNNPFGAAAAACFAVANVFRHVFRESLQSESDSEIAFCTLHHVSHSAADCSGPTLSVDLGNAHLIGAGAIGNAFIWALVRVGDVRGTLHVVDPERVALADLQRYVLTQMDHVSMEKTALAESCLPEGSGMLIRGHSALWGQYLAQRATPWRLDGVALAVDSARDRYSTQAALPRQIYNAWTQTGDLGISRHRFGETACVMCLYLPTDKQKNEDQLVAEAIGLPNRVIEVRVLLHNGVPVGETLVRDIATALSLPADELVPFASLALRQFYSQVICGGVSLRLQKKGDGAGSRTDTHVPMAFQSALAGVLLAATLCADSAGLPVPRETKTAIDLLRPLGTDVLVPVARDGTGRCICHDRDFLEFFRSTNSASLEEALTELSP